ncbi:MAG: tetratricopeptide repeat protein [Spirochaetia bacterium]|nr:tetratricopeptide repeat protein [Spirochaetia bacterium]
MNLLDRYYQRRALNAMVEEKWVEAERFLKRQMNGKPPMMGLTYNLGLCLLAQQRYEEAEQLFLASIERYGESLRLCRILGDLYYLWGRREDAHRWYEAAFADDPADPERQLIAERIRLTGEQECFDRVLESVELVIRARECFTEDPEQALGLYQKAADYDPTNIEALNNIGSIYFDHTQDPRTAATYFIKVLRLAHHQGAVKNLEKAEKAAAKEAKRRNT